MVETLFTSPYLMSPLSTEGKIKLLPSYQILEDSGGKSESIDNESMAEVKQTRSYPTNGTCEYGNVEIEYCN